MDVALRGFRESSARKSCRAEALEEMWNRIGICDNLRTPEERSACRRDAREAYLEALEECEEQFEARLDLCEDLPGPYDPRIVPARFVKGVDHPYFPLTPGTTFVYEQETDEGGDGRQEGDGEMGSSHGRVSRGSVFRMSVRCRL